MTIQKITVMVLVATGIAVLLLAFFLSAQITRPITCVALTLKDISEGEGDLTKSINVKSRDEVGELARYFNQTLEKIKDSIDKITKSTNGVLNKFEAIDNGVKTSSLLRFSAKLYKNSQK